MPLPDVQHRRTSGCLPSCRQGDDRERMAGTAAGPLTDEQQAALRLVEAPDFRAGGEWLPLRPGTARVLLDTTRRILRAAGRPDLKDSPLIAELKAASRSDRSCEIHPALHRSLLALDRAFPDTSRIGLHLLGAAVLRDSIALKRQRDAAAGR